MKKPFRTILNPLWRIREKEHMQATLCRNEEEAYNQMLAQLDTLSLNANSVETKNGEESLKESLRLLLLSSKDSFM